jgi:hypothetical protein
VAEPTLRDMLYTYALGCACVALGDDRAMPMAEAVLVGIRSRGYTPQETVGELRAMILEHRDKAREEGWADATA